MKNILITASTIMFAFLMLTTTSCNKEKNQESFFWTQTKCLEEPWKRNSNDIESAIIDYLKNEDIIVDDVLFEFDASLSQSCEACSCRTGTKIIVIIPTGNSIKMEELGFEKI